MAAKQKRPGSRKRVTSRDHVEISDHETGEHLVDVYWEPNGVMHIDHKKPHVRSRVVRRTADENLTTPPPEA